jgi:hypothetical protein
VQGWGTLLGILGLVLAFVITGMIVNQNHPESYRQGALVSFGGIAPVRDRPNPSYRTPITNLWFAGSQSESSGGVLGVMKGARAMAGQMRGA